MPVSRAAEKEPMQSPTADVRSRIVLLIRSLFDILIVDEPSVGIDIKTKAYLHELLRDLAGRGTAILLITSDMPEMIALADRIAIMNAFRIEGVFPNTRNYDEVSTAIMALIHGATGAASA